MVNTSLYNTLFSKDKQFGGKIKKLVSIQDLFYQKKGLLVATFANLIFQLLLTYYVMINNAPKDKKEILENRNKIWLYFLIQILIIVILGLTQLPSIVKFLLFSIFSYTFGLQLGYVKYFTSEEMIKFALLGTVSIFAVMFAIGTFMIISGINLGYKYGLILFYLLLGLIIFRLVILFSNTINAFQKILSVISILLFSVYIIYDTNMILQRNYYGDFITASLDYYLDIINIFLNFLSYDNN